jgi:hypothetical protein
LTFAFPLLALVQGLDKRNRAMVNRLNDFMMTLLCLEDILNVDRELCSMQYHPPAIMSACHTTRDLKEVGGVD